jgi:hypothetical protein
MTDKSASNGIKTSFWGPNAWNFLFSAIAGTYPIKYDINDKSHQKKVKSFIQLFNSLKETLPCIYCRQSYSKFLKELPMKDYLASRKSMMRWLYLLHDKVNKKLIAQEQDKYNTEHKRIKHQLDTNAISLAKYNQQMILIKSIKITKSSPPFESILNKIERMRAGKKHV